VSPEELFAEEYKMRRKMPNRRECETFDLYFGNARYAATVGYHPDGSIGEVFMTKRGKVGADMDSVLYDAGVLASLAIQAGATPEELSHSLARLSDGRTPASVIGAVISRLADEGKV
jgi:hypothetical protein